MTFDEAVEAYDAVVTVAEEQKAIANLLRVAREYQAFGGIDDDTFQNVLAMVQSYLDGEE